MQTTNIAHTHKCTLDDYKNAYNCLPDTCGGILKRLHKFDASQPCPPLTDVPKSRKKAMDFGLSVAGHRLNQVFDINRSYEETSGDVVRLEAIVKNLLWVYFRKTEWPEPQRWQSRGSAFPESTKYYYTNSHAIATRLNCIRIANEQKEAAEKRRKKEEEQHEILGRVALQERGYSLVDIERFSLEEIRSAGLGKFNARMHRQQTTKKSQGATKASSAVQMEFLTFLQSERYKESYLKSQPEHSGVIRTSGLTFPTPSLSLNQRKYYLRTSRDFSKLLSLVGGRCNISVDFTPGPQFVCFAQNRFNDFGKMPLEGGNRVMHKSGKLYAYTLTDGPLGCLHLGVDPPAFYSKTFEKKFACFTNPNPDFPAAGATRVKSSAHLLYQLSTESLTATFRTYDRRMVEVQVDPNRPANSVDGIVTELFPTTRLSNPGPAKTVPVQRSTTVDLKAEMNRLSLDQEVKKQEAKLAAMKREQAKKEQAKPVSDGIVDQLEKLVLMKNNGMLSQAQFDTAKARLLA